ncbi:MAG: HEAT repeat domain-containing protein [Planctomycetota bacterium]|jgi:hypothetical protein
MRPPRILLLPAVFLLLAGSVRSEDEGRTLAFGRYRAESLRRVFSGTTARSEERVIALRGLNKHDCVASARWLMLDVLAKSKEADVQREVVRLLTGYKRPATVAEMATIWEKKFKKLPAARLLSTLAFGPKKMDDSRRVLKLALADKDPRVVAAACRSIGTGDDDTFKDALIKLLKHKEPLVRSEAALALAGLFETDTRPLLFAMFCKDKSRFVQFNAWRALRKLDPKSTLPCDVKAWEDWWGEQVLAVPDGEESPWGKSFPGKNSKVKAARWFGIPVLADRVVFVVDATQRMDQGWKIDPGKERKKPKEERIPNFFSVKTRYALATSYLNDCIKQLPDGTQVAVAFYHDKVSPPNHHVFPESGKWLKLKTKTRATIAEHALKYEPGGTSSLYEGLRAAWEFGARKKPVKNGAQVICFLTVGKPTGGEFKDRPERIQGEVWKAAQGRGIVINAVGLHHHAFAMLKDFAKGSGGLYVHRQEEGDTVEPQDLDFWPAKKKAFEEARKKRKAGKK